MFKITSYKQGISLFFTVSIFTSNSVNGCKNVGQNAGEAAARELKKAVESMSENISRALTESTRQLSSAINNAVYQLNGAIRSVSQELGSSIRKLSGDLVLISEKLTRSIDKGVEELSAVLKEAIAATREITSMLTATMNKAMVELGKQIENIVKAVAEITNQLSKSLDKAFAELGTTLRYFADKISEIAKQVEVKINSKDLVGVADATGNALIQSVEHLTTNWKIAANTADLKDVGKGAADSLSKALQNLRGYFELNIGINDNLRRAIKYMSISAAVVFSVLFTAILVGVKSCRKCILHCCEVMARKGRCCCFKSANEDEDKKDIETTSEEVKLNNLDCPENEQKNLNHDLDDNIDEVNEKKKFDKRSTKSYKDYNIYTKLRNKWEQKAKNTGEEGGEKS